MSDLIFTPTGGAIGFVLFGASIVLIAKLFGFVFMSGKSQHRIGDAMTAARIEVTEWSGHTGYVTADGELWRARSKEALEPGDEARVVAMNGLILDIQKKKG